MLAFLLFSFLVGCFNQYELQKPEDTNLEFWLTENVDDFDYSEHVERYGGFGCTDYYGLGYNPLIDEYEQQVDPEECVIYRVSSYPDCSNRQQCITSIQITDPNVVFFGLRINSSLEEFDAVFLNKGFTDEAGSNLFRRYVNGKYTVVKNIEQVYFMVEVSNKYGIIY